MRCGDYIKVVLFGWLAFFGSVGCEKGPAIAAQDPESIDILIRQVRVGSITNVTAIVALLRSARPVSGHDCAVYCSLRLNYANGKPVEFAILPGHVDERYEFVLDGGYFGVPRGAFVSTLADAGINTNTIPTRCGP